MGQSMRVLLLGMKQQKPLLTEQEQSGKKQRSMHSYNTQGYEQEEKFFT
jgi:polyribonucleotide nucleotidyltransferase